MHFPKAAKNTITIVLPIERQSYDAAVDGDWKEMGHEIEMYEGDSPQRLQDAGMACCAGSFTRSTASAC